MRLLKNFRIKNKIIIIIIIIGTVSAITGNIINYLYELNNTKLRLIENTTLHAKLIAENCWLPLEFNYPKNAADELLKLHAIPEVQDAVLYNLNDTIFAAYSVAGNEHLQYTRELKNSDFYIDGDNLYIKQTVVHNNKLYGTIYLHSNINWSSIVASRLIISISMVALMLLLIILFAFILQGSISRPIIELSHQMSVVAQNKDYTVQLKNTDKDEVGELYSEFNNMLSEINKRENELQSTFEALRKSEAIQNKMVSNIGDVIVIIDQNGINQYKSPNITQLFGWMPEELVGHSTWDNVHPDDLESAQRFVGTIFNEPNSTGTIEIRYQRKDREYVWIEIKLVNLMADHDIKGLLGNYHEITERKIVESEMVELYKKLAVLNQLVNSSLKSASVGAWWIDFAEHDTFHALDTTVSLLEMPVNEMGDEYKISGWVEALQKAKTFSPEFAKLIDDTLEQFSGTISGKYEVYRAEYPVFLPDNSIRWIDARADVSKRDANGKALNMTGTLIDITERKKVEEELQNSEAKFAKAFRFSPDIIFITYLNNGQIIDVNERFEPIIGYKREDIIGKTTTSLGIWIEPLGREKYISTLKQHGYVRDMEIKFQTHSGKIIDTLMSSEIIDLQGSKCVLGTIRDISDRKQAEKQLERYRENLEELVEARTQELEYSLSLINAAMNSTADGILVVNRDGHIARWNQKFVNLWQVPKELLNTEIKDPVLGFVAKQMADPDKFLSKVLKLYEHPEAISTDMLKLADGRVFERYSQPQQIGDEIVGRVWSFRNITEQKQAEENLERAKELAESANRAKSIFLANMTHEIRTPMNAVLGFSQLLVRDTALSNESLSKVSTIIKSGEHLMGIINEILEVSRIEAGRVEIRNESVDLFSLLNDLAVMFRMQAEEKGLTFTLEIDKDIPRYIITDMGKLRQILINLLGNAVKFTQKGSISINAYSSGIDRVTIIVKDTGIGISPEEQQNLFHPFERTRSGEQVAGGTGLGLVISREYAHLLEGEITIKSEVNTGSSFLFEFHAPTTAVLPISAEITHRVKALSPNQGTIMVLIVDDQQTNRDLLRFILEPLGFIVDEAVSGEEGIAKACTILPHIILMDLVMPGMNGIEATKIIRKTCLKQPITIIGISASAYEMEKQNFMNAGINAFIAKPFHEQDLFDLLTLHAGVRFETEEVKQLITIHTDSEALTFEKMTPEWRNAFAQALAQGSITHIRQLGEAAKEFDLVLSAYIIDRVNMYDINGLKKLI